MDDIPKCPEWWSQLVWRMHFPIKIPGWKGPNPPHNRPQEMDQIYQGLAVHTMTFSMKDQKAAQVIRTQLEESLTTLIKGLSRSH
jgi:hypothetical protein